MLYMFDDFDSDDFNSRIKAIEIVYDAVKSVRDKTNEPLACKFMSRRELLGLIDATHAGNHTLFTTSIAGNSTLYTTSTATAAPTVNEFSLSDFDICVVVKHEKISNLMNYICINEFSFGDCCGIKYSDYKYYIYSPFERFYTIEGHKLVNYLMEKFYLEVK